MYVCGITPYDTTHLGHAFTYVFFDVLQRYLTFQGYQVNYTQNVTDIDDDLLKKAQETGQNWQTLGQFWTDKFLQDMTALNVSSPTHYVKATDSIHQIINMSQVLIQKGLAYHRQGHVYFEIKKINNYGKLSKYTRGQMLILSRERGANPGDPLKKDPLDFLLWQRSTPGEPAWDSPWGPGRPGWHIECSAMATRYLGDQIDIHGGGKDLIYPHHDSEIAQSESFTNKSPFVKYWLHTAMVMHQGEKMSKSLGNLVMVADLLKKYSANAIRWVLLAHHYRMPWEFDEQEMKKAEKNVSLLQSLVSKQEDAQLKSTKIPFLSTFIKLMNDDLNTPAVMGLLCQLARKIQHQQKKNQATKIKNSLKTIMLALGFCIEP